MTVTSQQQVQILHVDDQPNFTDLTATFLERDDDQFTVETASSANDGLEMIEDRPPDCVVSDYNMPGMDGLEFLQAVREEYPDLPFILFTGKGSEEVASEAIAADVTDYLQKGSGSEKYELLANRIRNAVQARRETRRAERQEQLMRLTEFAGGTGGFELDRERGKILLTAGTRRIIGRPDQSEISLEAAIALFHPDDRETIQRTLTEAFETGEELHDTWRLQPDDGGERLLEVTITPVVENGEVTKLRGAGHDITDRKERQQDLEQARDLMSNMEKLADTGAWEYDSESETLMITDGTRRLYGLDSDADLTLDGALDAVHPEDRELLADRFNTCLETGEPYEIDLRLTTTDGEQRWITAQGERVESHGSGGVIRGYIQDITDQVADREELERQNDLLEKSQDLAKVGAWEYNPQERESYFTDMVYDIYGVESDYDPAPGTDIQAFYHPDDRDTVRTAVEAALESGEEYDIEVRITAADGTEKWIRTRGTPHVEDGTVQRVRGTIQDITERKEREQELQDIKSQYETLVENFPDGSVFLIDTDLRYVRAGGEELGKVGLSSEDVEGTKPHALFPEDIADETCQYYEEALDGNANTYEQVYEGERYRIQTVPIRTDGEEIDQLMAVSQNITERAEDRQNLEAENERLEEFVSIVSHDLRSPLTVAEGNLELAGETGESEALAKAADAIERSQALIDDLLKLAQDGDQFTGIDAVALADVAESSWQTTETRSATLDVDATQAVRADRSRLQQLFENLYRNAVEHGGADVTVSVGAMDGGFYVSDTGPGIPVSDREEVFEGGYSTSEDGTGFGLRIVEQIADAHGWEVTVTESEQGGARFEVTGVELMER